LLKRLHGISYIEFAEDLTMSSVSRTMDLCNALSPLNIKWMCEGRLNYASGEVLEAMRDSGCVFINYGIESLNEKVLKNMKKGLTKKAIVGGIEETLKCGISPGLNIIWGNIGDTLETLEESVEFLIKYDDCEQLRTIRPVTPYPGCELYDFAISNGLLKDVEDFYENKHVNSDLITVNFTDMPIGTMYDALYSANTRLLDNYYSKQKIHNDDLLSKLYLGQDASFRGFRQT